MTLQELLNELTLLPASARTASVLLCRSDDIDYDVASISYESGEVIIKFEDENEKED